MLAKLHPSKYEVSITNTARILALFDRAQHARNAEAKFKVNKTEKIQIYTLSQKRLEKPASVTIDTYNLLDG